MNKFIAHHYSLEEKKEYLIFFLAFSFLMVLARLEYLIILYLFSILSILSPQNRKGLLNVSTVIAFFVANPYFWDASIELKIWSFFFFVIFNMGWIFLTDRLPRLKTHPFITMLLIGLLIYLYVTLINYLGDFTKQTRVLFNPIFFSFFAYLSYVKHGLGRLRFWEKLLWIKPFWFVWIVPLGNLREATEVRNSHLSFYLIRSRLINDLKRFSLFILIFLLFENFFFTNNYYMYKLDFLPSFMKLPYTHTQGFLPLLEGHLSKWEMGLSQFFSSLHYIGSAYLYTTAHLCAVTLSGSLIHPHTDNFWKAKSFSEFYFRISYHYSVLIKYYVLKPLGTFLKFIKNNDVRMMLSVFISVTLVCMICMFFGRGLRYKGYIFGQNYIMDFFANYHYSVYSGVVCAFSNYVRTSDLKKFFNFRWQLIRTTVYLFISSILFVFAFSYLISNSDVKIEFIRRVFGI